MLTLHFFVVNVGGELSVRASDRSTDKYGVYPKGFAPTRPIDIEA